MNRRKFVGKGTALSVALTLETKSRTDEAITKRAKEQIADHVSRVRPLEIAGNIAWWNANTIGRAEDFKKKEESQNRLDAELSRKDRYEPIRLLAQDLKAIEDPATRRSIELLNLTYLEKQVDPTILKGMVALSNRVEKAFNEFRPVVQEKVMTDNEVRGILKNSTDSNRRKLAWEGAKAVGKVLGPDLKKLVVLRNQAAKSLGFDNFHAMMLHLNEQKGPELIQLFDELDALTAKPFFAAKAEMDQALAKNCSIKTNELMPWHYHDPFFQESPAVLPADLDTPWQKADLLKICRDFYRGIGLPIERVLEKSDLYEKKGKSPHAFCTDINREGDVRVLANITPGDYWASTMLHELGHAVYSSLNIPAELPYVLRAEAHILTTEGTAMMFERLAKRSSFLKAMGIPLEDPKAFGQSASKSLRWRLLIFSRWCQVMLRFEKGMYENPGQDLNRFWWELVEKYQGLRRPPNRSEPDYASKIHIVTAPVYYHNYMMGELFASQVHHSICREVYPGKSPNEVDYVGSKAVGDFMRARVFAHGRMYGWAELIQKATGEKLSAKAFAMDFQES